MKLLAVFLLDVLVVAVALFVYDQLRGEPAASNAPAFNARASLATLEERIEALEAAPPPSLPDPGTDPRVLDRLRALEEASTAPAPAGGGMEGMEPDPEEIGPESVRAFRLLREKVRREESARRNRVWIQGVLDELRLNLTDEQCSQIVAAYAAFEPRRDEVWTEAKSRAQETITAGGRVDRKALVEETTAVIQHEFAEALEGIVHPADAESVAEAMTSKGR